MHFAVLDYFLSLLSGPAISTCNKLTNAMFWLERLEALVFVQNVDVTTRRTLNYSVVGMTVLV